MVPNILCRCCKFEKSNLEWAIPEIVHTLYVPMLKRLDIRGSQGKLKFREGPKKGKKSRELPKIWKKIQGGPPQHRGNSPILKGIADYMRLEK